MYDGIPVVYYGQEQYFKGMHDPANREPLWPSRYQDNDIVRFIASMNQFRNFLVYSSIEPASGKMSHTAADWLHQPSQILSYTTHEIVLARGPVISVLTGRGSAVSTFYPGDSQFLTMFKPTNDSASVLNSGYPAGHPLTEYVNFTQPSNEY